MGEVGSSLLEKSSRGVLGVSLNNGRD